ncbi:MAG: twin-arginine translocation pathway signal protein, partial [Pseudomonadota bacterium]
MTKLFRAGLTAALMAGTAMPALAAGDPIREINIVTRPQAAQPAEFQFVSIIAQEWRKLGLEVNVEVMPWEQM